MPPSMAVLRWTRSRAVSGCWVPVRRRCPGCRGWQAASRLKMRPDAAELAVRQSRKFPRAQLTGGLAALYEADSRLKSGAANPQAVMEFLVTQLAAG